MTRKELVKEVKNLSVQHHTRIPLNDKLDILCVLCWRSDTSVEIENFRLVKKGTKKVVARVNDYDFEQYAWNRLGFPQIDEFRKRIQRACDESDAQAKASGLKKSEYYGYFEDIRHGAGV